jgi:hypothetical protein
MGLFRDIVSVMFGRPMTRLQVEQMLMAKAAASPEKLDWRNSVVDLMKLLGMDSGIENRKTLAQRLGYNSAMGTAAMNIWLHDRIMENLAANNGVPNL